MPLPARYRRGELGESLKADDAFCGAGMTLRGEDRGVSEMASVGILVGLTVLVTASVGLGVMFVDVDAESGITATFSFEYRGESSMLLISPAKGDPLPAGDIEVQGRRASTTWAELAGMAPNETVEPGGLPVQLSESSAWGSSVSTAETIEIYYAPSEYNRTVLDSWSG